ncbi:MAG TPA: RCC1 domain-containing protein [Streptosporangiaceae bacterium]|nr:RCC1 domain-containing protein [Streptosporangiaceae bacterium]
MSESISAWGDNSNGQLGDGSTTGWHVPVQVKGLDEVVKVEAGSGQRVAETREMWPSAPTDLIVAVPADQFAAISEEKGEEHR